MGATKTGTGKSGQIQGRNPNANEVQDIAVEDNGSIRIGMRYYNATGVPTAQGQIALNASLRPPTGIGNGGEETLTDADTAYQIPPSGSVPAGAYILAVWNNSATQKEWTFKANDTGGGGMLTALTGQQGWDLGANQSIEVWCSGAGETVKWTTKII